VNIGDVLNYWTNGLLRSTVHRVVFPAGESADRYSIAYFAHPVGSAVLEPVPSERVRRTGLEAGERREGEGAMTADEHLMGRLKATYAGLYRDKGEGGGEGPVP
jgi:isopenicillin N synthase-like dioxygenase